MLLETGATCTTETDVSVLVHNVLSNGNTSKKVEGHNLFICAVEKDCGVQQRWSVLFGTQSLEIIWQVIKKLSHSHGLNSS